MRLVHSESAEDFSMPCPVSGCGAIYPKANSVLSHIYRKHRNEISSQSCAVDDASPGESMDAVVTSATPTDLLLPDNICHDVDILLHRDEHERKKKSSLFLMHLKEERMITQAAIQDVVSGCKKVFEHTVGHLKAAVYHKFSESGFDASVIDGLQSVFENATNPFAGLESQYLQEKFITQELGCIVSYYND